MTSSEWLVHPNRSELGASKPGRNGHYRSLRDGRSRLPVETCEARITLPRNMSRVADRDGTTTFSGASWLFVMGAARTFARTYIGVDVPPPFGYRDGGKWWWWDDTTTDESILDGPDAAGYVREYLERLFPGMAITLSEHQ